MDLELQIAEEKRKTASFSNLIVDLKYLPGVIQKVFSGEIKSTNELSELYNLLRKLCDDSTRGINEVKSIIPSNVEKIESE